MKPCSFWIYGIFTLKKRVLCGRNFLTKVFTDVTKIGVQDITHLEFEEDWFTNENGEWIKKVKAVCLYTPSFEADGTYRGRLALMWVNL